MKSLAASVEMVSRLVRSSGFGYRISCSTRSHGYRHSDACTHSLTRDVIRREAAITARGSGHQEEGFRETIAACQSPLASLRRRSFNSNSQSLQSSEQALTGCCCRCIRRQSAFPAPLLSCPPSSGLPSLPATLEATASEFLAHLTVPSALLRRRRAKTHEKQGTPTGQLVRNLLQQHKTHALLWEQRQECRGTVGT